MTAASAEATEAQTTAAAAGLQVLQHEKEVLETQLDEVSNECGRLQVRRGAGGVLGGSLASKVWAEFNGPQAHPLATAPPPFSAWRDWLVDSEVVSHYLAFKSAPQASIGGCIRQVSPPSPGAGLGGLPRAAGL